MTTTATTRRTTSAASTSSPAASPAAGSSPPTTATLSNAAPPLETSADQALAAMSTAQEQEQAAAVFEPATKATRYAPFNPPPTPRLVAEGPEHTAAEREAIRAGNRSVIATYNAQYEGYLRTFGDAVACAGSLEQIRRIGEPVAYNATLALPVAQRAHYDGDLAPPATQNARSVYEAIESRRLADSGERAPMSVAVKVEVSGELGSLRGKAGFDGTQAPGARGSAQVGLGGDARTLKGHFDDKPATEVRTGYVRESKALVEADEAAAANRKWREPNASFDVSVGADGSLQGQAGLSLGTGLGGNVKKTADGYEAGLMVLGSELSFGDDGLKSVTVDAKLMKVGYDGTTLTTEAGVSEELSMLGLDAKAEAKVRTACDGQSVEMGASVGGGIEGVLSVSADAAVNVNLVSKEWVKRAISSAGFFR